MRHYGKPVWKIVPFPRNSSKKPESSDVVSNFFKRNTLDFRQRGHPLELSRNNFGIDGSLKQNVVKHLLVTMSTLRYATTTVTALAFCISGSALTLLNKQIMHFLPAPNLVLFAQNAATLVLLRCGKVFCTYEVDPLEKSKVLRWLPLVFLFYGMLASSMLALTTVTATTLIVQRNLGTVSIAVADYFYIGTVQSNRRILSIVGMCIGSVGYALFQYTDLPIFDFYGYTWLAVNVASTTAYQIKVKSLVTELGLNSWTMAYYNNTLSLPFCLLFSIAMREKVAFGVFLNGSTTISRSIVIFSSCTMGFCLSVSAFQLNRLISPTSITILNNTNKFVLIFFTAYFMDFSTLSSSSMLCAMCVISCAAFYSLVKK